MTYVDYRSLPLLLLCLSGQLNARTYYSQQKQNSFPMENANNTDANYVITKWRDNSASMEVAGGLTEVAKRNDEDWDDVAQEYPEIYTSNDVGGTTLEEEELSTVVALLQSLSGEMASLRNQMSNVKYQNHIIYKQLKRMNNRCMNNPAPMLRTSMCPKDFTWHEELQKCFKFGHDRITWRMAREKCRAMDADLISIPNSQTQHYVAEAARKSKEYRHCDFWVGANDQKQEGDWRWSGSDMQLLYANWNHNEPNNGSGDEHCAMMLWVFNWAWNDARCKTDNACYICETTLI